MFNVLIFVTIGMELSLQSSRSFDGKTKESDEVLMKLSEAYNHCKTTLDRVVDQVVIFHGANKANIRNSIFYDEIKRNAAETALKDYLEHRAQRGTDNVLKQLGINLGKLIEDKPADIKSKYEGQDKLINDLTRLRTTCLQTLKHKEQAFKDDFNRLLVILTMFSH